jgi:hypothetical protein
MKTCKLPGFFEGRTVRQARRMCLCDEIGPSCKRIILRGEYYQEGSEVEAPAFGLRRHCLRCRPAEIASALGEPVA